MGLIKEPLDVDFYFDGKQTTDADQQRVSISRKKRKKEYGAEAKARKQTTRVTLQLCNCEYEASTSF